MNQYLLMMQVRLLSLTAQMEQMKADNELSKINGEPPTWSGDHFAGLAHDFDSIATELAK